MILHPLWAKVFKSEIISLYYFFPKNSENLKSLHIGLWEVGEKRPLNRVRNTILKKSCLVRQNLPKNNLSLCDNFTPFISKSFQIWDHFFALFFPNDSEFLNNLDIQLSEVGAKGRLNGTSKVNRHTERQTHIWTNQLICYKKSLNITTNQRVCCNPAFSWVFLQLDPIWQLPVCLPAPLQDLPKASHTYNLLKHLHVSITGIFQIVPVTEKFPSLNSVHSVHSVESLSSTQWPQWADCAPVSGLSGLLSVASVHCWLEWLQWETGTMSGCTLCTLHLCTASYVYTVVVYCTLYL